MRFDERSFEFARRVVTNEDGSFTTMEVQAYPEAKLPQYATKHSACADFYCAEEVLIPSIWSGWTAPTLVHTGIKANMHEDEVLMIFNTSGLPKKKGLLLANSVGIIDADYYECESNDGEIMFAYYNLKKEPVTINVGDKIGQGMFQKRLLPDTGLVIRDAERVGGFGSTGK